MKKYILELIIYKSQEFFLKLFKIREKIINLILIYTGDTIWEGAIVTSLVSVVGCIVGVILGVGAIAGAIFGGIMVISVIAIRMFLESPRVYVFFLTGFTRNFQTKESKLSSLSRYKLLKLSEILFSAKTQREVFLPVMADWDCEIYKALKKNKNASLFMINLRNSYAFLAAMWMKSPIGDLIQFVIKIAKQ